MRISENLLKRFLSIPKNIKDITINYITEVESFSILYTNDLLVVGYVESKTNHPNANNLSLTKVNVGTETLNIVCGAPNVDAGQYVCVALVGAKIGSLDIKPVIIRGEESNGMICSLSELDIQDFDNDANDGIFVLDGNYHNFLGKPFFSVVGLDGFNFDLSITANRPDLNSYVGFAKDVALKGGAFHYDIPDFKETTKPNPVKVTIDTPHVTNYLTRYLYDIKIVKSPYYIRSILIHNNIKPINNIVDITNLVMLEYGIPLHAFDANKLKSKHITVKQSNNDETITLDGIKRITKDDIVITCENEIIAIAGVMGSYSSMVDELTSSIVLEAAVFYKESIKKTGKKLKISSAAQKLFEKGVNPYYLETALNKVCEYICKFNYGKVACGINGEIKNYNASVITLSLKNIKIQLGVNLNKRFIFDTLNLLECKLIQITNDVYSVEVHPTRTYIDSEKALIGELGRIYGYSNIKNQSLPPVSGVKLTKIQEFRRKVSDWLANNGFNEVISYSLINDTTKDDFGVGMTHTVLQPITPQRTNLRKSLISGLLEVANYNVARKNNGLSLFEIGHVFNHNNDEMLAILLTGDYITSKINSISINSDFFVLKSVFSSLCAEFFIEFDLEVVSMKNFHPYIQANILINGEVVGIMGKIHPNYAKNYDLKDVLVLEINLNSLMAAKQAISYQKISPYPSIQRDLSFVLRDQVNVQALTLLIKQTGTELLKEIDIFDYYTSNNETSIAYSLTFNDEAKTLDNSEVDKIIKEIIINAECSLNIKLKR